MQLSGNNPKKTIVVFSIFVFYSKSESFSIYKVKTAIGKIGAREN